MKEIKLNDYSKKSVLYIGNADNLCLPRAIVAGKIFAERGHLRKGALHNRWDNVSRVDSRLQRQLAEDLVDEAGVVIPAEGCGLAELRQFQEVLAHEGVAIVVFDFESFGSREPPFFDGTEVVLVNAPSIEHNIYLLHSTNEGHYDLILKLGAAAGTRFFCIPCGEAYDRATAHRCDFNCPCCKTDSGCNIDAEKIRCPDCRRFFRGNACFVNHKAVGSHGARSTLCSALRMCGQCLKQVYKVDDSKHECGKYYCKVCKEKRSDNHLCFIAREKRRKPKGNPKTTVFIFYDFETRLEKEVAGAGGTFIH